LEPTSSTSWLPQTARRLLQHAHEVAAVMAVDEPMVRFQGTAWARRRVPRMPEGTGINVSSTIPDYNHFLGGVDQHDATLLPRQHLLAEDVLR
jgi:hypothetical protein